MANYRVLGVLAGAIFFAISSSHATKAKRFLNTSNARNEPLSINPDVLLEIRKLKPPIRIVAALGDARTGRSTALNLFSHLLSGTNQSYSEIFKTGNSFVPVTRGIWAHAFQPRDGEGSFLLLDCQGINFGEDAQIDVLGMFTGLISSTLTIFVNDFFGNNNLDFLFRVSRSSHVIFRNVSHDKIPNLHVVLRGALKPPKGRTLEDIIRDRIAEYSFENEGDTKEKKKFIARHFPRDRISVSGIPFVDDPALFEEFPERLRGIDYWEKMMILAERLKEFPVKKTPNGTPIDGIALEELVVKFVAILNGAKPDLMSDYIMIEQDICRRRYVELVKPVLSQKAGKIYAAMAVTLDTFKMECALEGEVAAAKEELQRKAKSKLDLEELERKLEEAKEKEIQAEEKLKETEMESKKKIEEKEKEVQKLKTMRENIEAAVILTQQLLQEIIELEKKLKEEEEKWRKLEKRVAELENTCNSTSLTIQALNKIFLITAYLNNIAKVEFVNVFMMAFGGFVVNQLRRYWPWA